MLNPQAFRLALRPIMSLAWPARRLWPEVRPLFSQQDLMQELRSSMQLMDRIQRQLLEDTEPFMSRVVQHPVFYQLNKEGDHFGLTLDTQGFSPEELSVKQVGKKLRIMGRSEKKQEDQKGSYSYRLQEFRQEFDLPEGVNHEAVSCYLSPDGKLHIQAAKDPSAEPEKELAIKRSSEEKPQQIEPSQKEQASPEMPDRSKN